MIQIIFGCLAGVAVAISCIFAYRQGIIDGTKKSKDEPLTEPIRKPKPKKDTSDKTNDFDAYIAKNKKEANNL